MGYKVLYLEDDLPDTIKTRMEEEGIEVVHVNPKDMAFEKTLEIIDNHKADLLLMDFRLNAGLSRFNAPPFAQFYRSQTIGGFESIPIVIISSEENIRDYYGDYTSFDLFDLAVDKGTFLSKKEKYCNLLKELIDAYKFLNKEMKERGEIELTIFNIPSELEFRIDRRFMDIFLLDKYQTNACMMTGLILSSLVKPVGMLIGEDILAARLGIKKTSPQWPNLLKHLKKFKYSGLYGKTYNRWWAQGIEIWWEQNFPGSLSLRRLSADDRCRLINEKYSLNLVSPDHKELSLGRKYWTICCGDSSPLDSTDGYEIVKDFTQSPWVEPSFYSFDYLVNNADKAMLSKLKENESTRYMRKVKE